jgi:hypothetical protein
MDLRVKTLFRATGGTMRIAFRATATATALALSWAAAVGCASGGQKTQARRRRALGGA